MPARQSRLAANLTTAGVVYACALIPAAFFAPVYQGEISSSDGSVTHTTATLVGVNGSWVVALACVPLVLALVAWVGLSLRCRRGSRFGGVLGWTVSTLLLVFALVGLASIGLFVLPVALLLLAGAALTPAPASS